MTAPVAVVEVGYGATWQTEPASITWVDETLRVLHDDRLRCRRGGSSVRGSVDVGTAVFSLLNSDRRFDPTHASGPLFGDLLPGTPVRISAVTAADLVTWDGDPATWDEALLTWGDLIPVWSGTVPSWPQRYDVGNSFGWCPITAYDRFDKLSRAKMPRSVMESAIMPLAPVGYWPLDDPDGSRYANDVTGANMGTVWDDPVLSGPPLAPGLGPSAKFDGLNDRIDLSQSPLVPEPYESVTVVAVIRTTVTASAGVIRPVFWQSDGNGPGHDTTIQLLIDADGRAERTITEDGFGVVSRSLATVSDGLSHLVMIVSGTAGVFGVCVDSATFAHEGVGGTFHPGSGSAIGGTPRAPIGQDNDYFDGEISNVALWDRPLVLAEREAIVAAYEALSGQRTDERLVWVLDEIGWPSGFRSVVAGRSLLGPATLRPGDGVLEYLRLITATEDGRLFMAADGDLTFHDRYWPYLETAATTSQFTFTDTDGDQGYAEFQLDLDDELLVNVARFARRDGATQVAVNQSSVATFGESEKQLSNLLSTTDTQVRSLAEWAVATGATPLPRVPTIRIPLHRYADADQATVLGLELGHRVTVQRTPQGVGSQIELDMLVEGVEHDVAVGEWWVTLFVSPVPQDAVELFLLGSSLLGSTDILAH